jgi:ABC-2 type transport system permease protein
MKAVTRKRLRNILIKEWRTLAGDTTTFLLIGLVPFMILGEAMVAIILIANIGGTAMAASSFFQTAFAKLVAGVPAAAGLPPVDQVRLLLLTQFNFFILLIPTMIAIYSAAYSIVEEKLSHSLEPLLATPVRTWELMLGKALAGAIPALIMTWVCAALSLLVVDILKWGYLLDYLVGANWYLNLFLLTPGIAVLSFLLGVIGSSRARDFRNAQNMVLFIVFPIFALIAVQVTGVVWFTPLYTLILGIAIGLVDVGVLRVAVRLFRRESILVRWR